MFSAPFTLSQHGSRIRLMTLGGPQFVVLALGLLTFAVILAVLLERDISETFYRHEVRQFEQKLGFEVGRIKGFPMAPPAGIWGIARVTPGGAMDQAGMQSGDLVFSYHGYSFAELRWAISEAARGRTACVFVMNAEEALTGAGREVCVKSIAKE
jgi:hypothetical protein